MFAATGEPFDPTDRDHNFLDFILSSMDIRLKSHLHAESIHFWN